MLSYRIRQWGDFLRRVITEPRSELTRWQRTVRLGYLLGRHGARRLREGRAQEIAAALAFRTLFGLLPVLVVGTILVRSFSGWARFRQAARELLYSLGLEQVRVFHAPGEATTSLADWLLGLLDQAETINLAAIGWVGVAVVLYSALGLMVTIENSFNTIYEAPQGRSWTRRLPNYWLVLSLAPAAIALTMLVDDRIDALIHAVPAWNWLLAAAGALWSVGAAWAILFVIYKVVPNTQVGTRPALAGAGVAALLLSIGRLSLGAYLENALSIRQLYGSLGLIPLFMFWIYLMWLIVLYGLEVAAILQTVRRHEIEQATVERERPHAGLVDPAAVLAVMEFVAQRFGEGRPATRREIAEHVGLPPACAEKILTLLHEQALVHRLDGSDGEVTLARPPESIEAARLIELGFDLVDEGRRGQPSSLLARLRQAQRESAGDRTLAALLH